MKKVNFLCLIMLGLFFVACHSNDDTWGDWSRGYPFSGRPRTGAVTFTLNGEVYVGLGRNEDVEEKDKYLTDFWKFNGTRWVSVASFPTYGRAGAVAFVVGEEGHQVAYVGTGYREYLGKETYYDNFYTFDGVSWDTTTVIKLPKPADRKDGGRRDGIAFSLNGKGYVGTGLVSGGMVVNDIYCFDPSKSGDAAWSNTEFRGEPRCGAVAFVIKDKAVVCLGAAAASGSNFRRDVYTFDGTTWQDREPLYDQDGRGFDNDYNQIPRAYAVAFVSSKDGGVLKGYVATGNGSYPGTCWEYNIDTDRWDEVTELPAAMNRRAYAVGFTFNDYGYVTTGGSTMNAPLDIDTWKFTPGIDEDDDNDYAPRE